MKRSCMILAVFGLVAAGCGGNVTVKMDMSGFASVPKEQLLADVTMNDLRRPGVAASTREAAFGVPMGNILFDPPEAQVLEGMLESGISKILAGRNVMEKRSYTCDLVEFGVNTNTTPIYWDVIGHVRIVLRNGGKANTLSGSATERTFIWPGEPIIARVVDRALRQVADNLDAIAEDL